MRTLKLILSIIFCVRLSESYSQNCSSLSSKLSQSDPTCFGGTNGEVSVKVSGGSQPYFYVWSDSVRNVSIRSNLGACQITCFIEDANKCKLVIPITLKSPPKLSISFVSSLSKCTQNTGSASAIVSGGVSPYNYFWDKSDNDNSKIQDVPAGEYNLTIKDANSCITSSTAYISDRDGPAISSKNVKDAICFSGGGTDIGSQASKGGSITLIASGGLSPYSYKWSTRDSTFSSSANNLTAGVYQVKITDARSCITFDQSTISEPPSISLTAQVTDNTCGNRLGKIVAQVSGGQSPYSYAWSNSAATTNILSNQKGGEGNVTVTDRLGCQTSASYLVKDINGPLVTLSVTDELCFDSARGRISASVSNGRSPYTYQWEPYGGTSAIAGGLICDNYKVTVTDAGGCKTIAKATVNSPLPLDVGIDRMLPSNPSSTDGAAMARRAAKNATPRKRKLSNGLWSNIERAKIKTVQPEFYLSLMGSGCESVAVTKTNHFVAQKSHFGYQNVINIGYLIRYLPIKNPQNKSIQGFF